MKSFLRVWIKILHYTDWKKIYQKISHWKMIKQQSICNERTVISDHQDFRTRRSHHLDLNLIFLSYSLIQFIILLIPHYKKIIELSTLKWTKCPLYPLEKAPSTKRLIIIQQNGFKGFNSIICFRTMTANKFLFLINGSDFKISPKSPVSIFFVCLNRWS